MKESYQNFTFLGFQCREEFRTAGSIRFNLCHVADLNVEGFLNKDAVYIDGQLDIHFTLKKSKTVSVLVVLERITDSKEVYWRRAAKEIRNLLEVLDLPAECAYEFLIIFSSEGVELSKHLDEDGMHWGS
jgi:hypothetical protein